MADLQNFRLPEEIGDHTWFTWGPVKKIHSIGRIHVVEYFPQIFIECHGTGRYEKETTEFQLYVDKKCTSCGFLSLESAIVSGLSDDLHGKAGHYACKILGIKE